MPCKAVRKAYCDGLEKSVQREPVSETVTDVNPEEMLFSEAMITSPGGACSIGV